MNTLKSLYINYKILLYSGFATFILYWYIISEGNFNLTSYTGSYTSYFSAESISMLHGKWGVDPTILGWSGDCFHYRNVCEGYFGLFPSVIRMPQSLFLNNTASYSFIYQLIAVVLYIFFTIALYASLKNILQNKSVSQLLYGIVAFASPIIFLAGRPYVYEEAILWGVTWLIATIVFSINYLKYKKPYIWYLSLISANCALQSRISEGIASLFISAAVLFLGRNNFQHLNKSPLNFFKIFLHTINVNFFRIILLMMTGASYVILNFWKFGVVYPSTTKAGYVNNPSNKFIKTLVNHCHPQSIFMIPSHLAEYLIPNFKNWPFFFSYTMGDYKFMIGSKVFISNSCVQSTEMFSPFSVTYPLSALFCVLGLYYLFKSRKSEHHDSIILISFFAFFSLVFTSSILGMTERYVADMLPAMVLLGYFGAVKFSSLKNKYIISITYSLALIQVFTCYIAPLSFYGYFIAYSGSVVNYTKLFGYEFILKAVQSVLSHLH
jgi:hypothetical protein